MKSRQFSENDGQRDNRHLVGYTYHTPFSTEVYVRRLYVTVDHALFAQVREAVNETLHDTAQLSFRQLVLRG